jgi:DNA/RNA-binding domain of Phe-tRNA-synthetase-like protein
MPPMLLIANRTPTANPAGGMRLGVVRAEAVDPSASPPGLDAALRERVRAESLSIAPDGYDEEARRAAARDMLRNGRYKPTGRGKPASEYLVRAASGDAFPRINALVDINNLISLEERLPISMWDLDRVVRNVMVFRAGNPGEEYVFNPSGQTLDVVDLVVGCAASGAEGDPGVPAVSPIKDSQRAKTTPETRRVAAAIFAPVSAVSSAQLEAMCVRFANWLSACGPEVSVTRAVIEPGGSARL